MKSVVQLSIITINFNNAVGLQKTMESVFNQTDTTIEYIVIDGGSNDGSKEYIEKHATKLRYWISETDKGIYNAMNKGIVKAKGTYLLFLNSGDYLADTNVIKNIIKYLKLGIDILYGNLLLGEEKQIMKFPEKLKFSYLHNNFLPHPSSFFKKSLFKKGFMYNEKYKISSDWEFFICNICKYNSSYKYIDYTITVFDLTGISSNIKFKEIMRLERHEILKEHFPLFADDFKEFNLLNNLFQRNQFKILKELQRSKSAKRISSLILKILFFLFRGKTPKSLN
jgi:glycosyltransferase involved in cell wall biosynthesis